MFQGSMIVPGEHDWAVFMKVQEQSTSRRPLGNKHSRIMCVHTESVDRGGVCHRI